MVKRQNDTKMIPKLNTKTNRYPIHNENWTYLNNLNMRKFNLSILFFGHSAHYYNHQLYAHTHTHTPKYTHPIFIVFTIHTIPIHNFFVFMVFLFFQYIDDGYTTQTKNRLHRRQKQRPTTYILENSKDAVYNVAKIRFIPMYFKITTLSWNCTIFYACMLYLYYTVNCP